MAAKTVSSSLSEADTRFYAGIVALVFGALVVFGVGLAHAQSLHDAAHDTRHSYGFPCH